MKKQLLFMCVVLASIVNTHAQTYLIQGGTGNGNFEAAVATSTWTPVSSSKSAWEIATAEKLGGTKGAYIRLVGGMPALNNLYDKSSNQKSHLFTAVTYTIPTSANCAYLSFWYKGMGELGKDFMKVYLTTGTPAGGSVPPGSSTQIGATEYSMQGTWVQAIIPIPASLYGTAQKVHFYWENDNNNIGTTPAIAIDDVELYYNTTGPANDNCAGAIMLPVGAFGTCSTTAGDVFCASNSGITAPVGTADDDLWYSFVSTASIHTINVGSTTINPVIQVFSGTCGALTSISSANAGTVSATGLTVGTTYYVRVYSFSATKQDKGAFTICVTTPPVCPADLGADYTTISSLPYSVTGATTCGMINNVLVGSTVSCGNSAFFDGEDVVYSFTPTVTGSVAINLTSSGTNTSLTLFQNCPFSGSCIGYNQSVSGTKSIGCANVVAGSTYYLVVDGLSGCNPYDLTITAPSTLGVPNDDACGGTSVFANPGCNFNIYDLTGACSSSNPPPTASCGDYNGQDVWFKFVVPTSGLVYTFDTKEGTMTDAFMAIYRSSTGCGGTLNLISCDNDASANGLMPSISSGSLVAGETIYIRIMPNGNAAAGTFQLCISSPCVTGSPSNDNPCGAPTIAIGGTSFGDNTCATDGRGTNEPPVHPTLSGSEGVYNSLWYKFVPTNSATSIRTTLGSLRNTMISVHSGTCGTGLVNVGANDDITICSKGSPKNSSLDLTGLTVGTTYYIMVDGYQDQVGDFSIAVQTTSVPWPLIKGSDCGAAKDLCDDTTSVANPGYQAFGNYCDLPITGTCVTSGEKSSVWFNIPITTAGTLAFDIVPNDYGVVNPFTGQSNPSFSGTSTTDYDFVVWKVSGIGPTAITSTCATIASTPATGLVGCNYKGIGVTGLANTGNAPAYFGSAFDAAFEPEVAVAAGESYLLMINNFANSTQGFTLRYTGTATPNFTLGAATTSVNWTGGNSTTSWNSVDNWGGCVLPACGVDAIIDPLLIQPLITAAMGTVSVNNLTINPGAILRLAPGATLKICGSLNNFGSLQCDPTSTILFNDENINHGLNGSLTGADAIGNLIIQDANNLLPPNCIVKANVDIDLKGSFTTINNSSILNINQKYMKLAGNFNNNANNVTFTGSNGPAGTLEFNGTGIQSYSQGTGNLILNNVVINQSPAGSVNVVNNTAFSKMQLSTTGSLTLTSGKITFSAPATQDVFVQNTANTAVTAGNITSYVEGKLRRMLASNSIGSYDFPVGNTSKGYQLINFNFTTAIGTILNRKVSLAANFNNWGGTFPQPAPLGVTECTVLFNNQWLDNGNWLVDTYDSTFLGGFNGIMAIPATYNATLYNRSYANAAASNGWTIAKSPSVAPAWAMDGVCQATPVTAVRRNNMTGFSRFATIQSAVVPLPIELANFNANAELTYNNVEWITATETNNNYFEVEASQDAVNFIKIATVKGAGNSNAELRYAIKDKNYYPTTYYRLKQVDFDGKYSYSELRVVTRFNKNSKELFMVDISPNPTQNEVKIIVTNGVKEEYRIDVLSIDGKLLMKRIIDAKDFTKGATLDLSALENGLYHVEISNSVGYVMKKVIKQ